MVDFGRDLSCTTSIRAARFSTGLRLVAEACFRRLTTPRGMLRGGEGEADYGLDVTQLVGSVQSASDVAALGGQIRNELLKDERLLSVEPTIVDVSVSPVSKRYQITVEATTADGPFKLVLAASAVTAELLGIVAEAA